MKNVVVVYDDGENEKMFFVAWIKNRADIPEKLKKLFEEHGAKEDEPIPMFSTDPDEALCFMDGGMALQIIKRLQEFYPEWKEKLYSIPFKSRHGNTAEERLLNAMFREAPEDENENN